MKRDELIAIVKQSNSTTLFACRMRDALGIPQPKYDGHARDRDANRRKYRGVRRLMKQRYGVKL